MRQSLKFPNPWSVCGWDVLVDLGHKEPNNKIAQRVTYISVLGRQHNRFIYIDVQRIRNGMMQTEPAKLQVHDLHPIVEIRQRLQKTNSADSGKQVLSLPQTNVRGCEMRLTVGDLLNVATATISNSAVIDDAIRIVLRERVSEVYIVDADRRLRGVLSDYELIKACFTNASRKTPVTALMNQVPTTLRTDADLVEAAALFRDGRYKRVAVVQDCRLVGQIDRADVLHYLWTAEQESTENQNSSDRDPQKLPIPRPRYFDVAEKTDSASIVSRRR
jgi:CBS domain-containing protein